MDRSKARGKFKSMIVYACALLISTAIIFVQGSFKGFALLVGFLS
jgi:hypothetical protein